METERLMIRKFSKDDWEDLHEYLSQEEVVKFEPYETFSIEESKQEAINRSENKDFWAVCLKSSKKLIGNIYLSKGDFNTWELGYVFNVNFQRKGYAYEACHYLINHVFKNENAHRIVAMCNPLNIASWKLLEKLKLRREGHLIKNIYFKQNEIGEPIWCDTYEYGLLSSEWTKN